VDPTGDLIDVNGKLYGATPSGGSSGEGTVFSVTPNGREKVLYSFAGGSDGAAPYAGLLDVNGTLYGTTQFGGGSGCFGSGGCGTVFSITTSGTENVLYRFAGGSDGADPLASLINVKGVLYGTTMRGGISACVTSGCGTVFSVTTNGSENVLYRFTNSPDGANPYAPLLDVDGTLYGTTESGGNYPCGFAGCGTVFSISPTGSETVVYRFAGIPDGQYPEAALINVNGTLYGTTLEGGRSTCHGCGTVYSVSESGKETVLHAFFGDYGSNDGRDPVAPLINLNGTLYGTTYGNTAFALTP
jgi:uncharacterized repeat protein (TIGR03803 family)